MTDGDEESGEGVSREEYEKLKKWYSETLKRKDEEIQRLRDQNKALLASAIKQAEQSLPPKEDDNLFGVGYKRDVRVHINEGKESGKETSEEEKSEEN